MTNLCWFVRLFLFLDLCILRAVLSLGLVNGILRLSSLVAAVLVGVQGSYSSGQLGWSHPGALVPGKLL